MRVFTHTFYFFSEIYVTHRFQLEKLWDAFYKSMLRLQLSGIHSTAVNIFDLAFLSGIHNTAVDILDLAFLHLLSHRVLSYAVTWNFLQFWGRLTFCQYFFLFSMSTKFICQCLHFLLSCSVHFLPPGDQSTLWFRWPASFSSQVVCLLFNFNWPVLLFFRWFAYIFELDFKILSFQTAFSPLASQNFKIAADDSADACNERFFLIAPFLLPSHGMILSLFGCMNAPTSSSSPAFSCSVQWCVCIFEWMQRSQQAFLLTCGRFLRADISTIVSSSSSQALQSQRILGENLWKLQVCLLKSSCLFLKLFSLLFS